MPRESETRPIASAHLLRFGAAIAILVTVSLTGVALEQRSLEFSRQYSLQTFRADRLEHEAAKLQLRIEELQTPQRLMETRRAPMADPDGRSGSRR